MIKEIVLPGLLEVYNNYKNAGVTGIYLLRNLVTGEYIGESYKYPRRSKKRIEVVVRTSENIFDEIISDIIDAIESIRGVKPCVYFASSDVKDSAELRRCVEDGLCVAGELDTRFEHIWTFENIFYETEVDNPLGFLMRYYPSYSIPIRKKCIAKEPMKKEGVSAREYTLMAALAHRIALDSFLDIPEWILNPCYTWVDTEFDEGVSDEFKFHKLNAKFEDFLNL